MSTTRVFTNPRNPEFSQDGTQVNANGRLYFREPGASSTTLKTVYADKDLTTPLINPVVLDSSGRYPTVFLDGDYNVQMTNSLGAQIWRIDNYQPITMEGQFDEYSTSLTYAVNDYVRDANGNYYISLQSGNTGNTPSTSPLWWSQAFFLTVYNASTTYAANAVVYYNGNIYTSLVGSNTGNTPDTSYTFWKRPGVSVPPVTGYQGSIIRYRSTSGTPTLNAISTISKAVSVTVGPSGSGANYIWTALDVLPSNTDSVVLSFESTITRTAGTSSSYSLTCNLDGVALTKAVKHLNYGSATEPSAASIVGQVDHPVDANNVFSVFWDSVSTDTETLFLSLIGFSVSEA